jgi:hypothetical protein
MLNHRTFHPDRTERTGQQECDNMLAEAWAA